MRLLFRHVFKVNVYMYMSRTAVLEHIISKKEERIADLELYVRRLWTRLNNATELLKNLNWSGDFCDICNKLENTSKLQWWDQENELLCETCGEKRYSTRNT